MKEQQVTQVLQEIAEQEVPASLDLWPAIQARLQPQRRASRWARWMPATRLGWPGLILGALLLFGGVAYALNPVISQVFGMFPGWQHVEEAHLAQELNLSQTLDGVTVTLERTYADANEILIGYTIKGPNGRRYDVYHLTLTDAAGIVFPGMFGSGMTGQSDILQVSLPPGEGVYVLAFDAAAVEGTPPTLHLRLTMELVELVLPPSTPELSPTPDSPPAEPPDVMVVVLEPLPTPAPEAIVGPFTFDFSVPFIPGQTVEVQQTVEAVGVAVRLERVVITPSETRAILCFEPPDGGNKDWTLIASLDTGDGQELSGGIVSQLSGTGKEDCHRVIYPDALAGRPGPWTLTVTELVGEDINQLESQIFRQADSAVVSVDAGDAAKFQTRLAGPWVFHFVVP
jgi:hypothetical protein